MNSLELYQNYWWLLIAILGAALVFMLFVQGGQSMLLEKQSETDRQLMVNSLGRKWELGFTALVVFGGAFFASFPLYYSTSFGGAYWLWMAILLSFVIQATAYEFRRKQGNVYGRKFYDILLLINGVFGPVLLGAAVGMMFFGGPFLVERSNLALGVNPVISIWAPTHGLEVMINWRCLLLGFTVFFLARCMASLYFLNNISAGESFQKRMRRAVLVNGLIFAVLFIAFCVVLLTCPGVKEVEGSFEKVDFCYWHNFLEMWWWGVALIVGVALVLTGLGVGAFTHRKCGIWPAGFGVALVIVSLFAVAGYNGTAYLPSTEDIASSLTIANSSSSLFTLKVMSWVSLLIPFVIAYIAVTWRKMNANPLSPSDVSPSSHQY